jgi:hypothetical protein
MPDQTQGFSRAAPKNGRNPDERSQLMRFPRPKLTYANVIATIALFVALGGAAVAAGLPKNSVGPKQLKRGAVTAPDIRKGAVTAGKIAPRQSSPASSAPTPSCRATSAMGSSPPPSSPTAP